MKHLILALVVTIFTACSTVPTFASYRELAAQVVPSNVELIGDFTNDWTGETRKDVVFCSGFQISQTQIVTAGHCVQSQDVRFGKQIKVRLQNGKVYLADVIKSVYVEGPTSEVSRDAALLEISVAELVNPVVFGDSTLLRQGDLVAVVGNTLGDLTHSFMVTYVGSVNRVLDVGTYIQVGPGAAGGNSGGPVFNMEGAVIGMLTRGADGVVGLVVPIERVMLELHNANGDTTLKSLVKWLNFFPIRA